MCGIAGCYGRNSIIISLALTLGQLERGTMGTGVEFMSVELVEVLKSLKESFEKTEKMIDILEESGFSIKDVHQALPTFIALMAMGVKKDSKEALRYIDLLCDSAKEIIEKFFCKER